MLKARNILTLYPTLSLKYLHIWILHNVFELKHITRPNGAHPMVDEFKQYHNTLTKVEKNALHYARLHFCEPSCHNQCVEPCLTHTASNALKLEYIIQNHHIPLRPQEYANHPLPPTHPEHPKPHRYIIRNPTNFLVHTILNKPPRKYKDKYKIIKTFTSYIANGCSQMKQYTLNGCHKGISSPRTIKTL